MLRFRSQYEESWTEVSFLGCESSDALNILATRLVARGDEVEIEVDDEWQSVEEAG